MNFTDSPFERMMNRPPYEKQRDRRVKPPPKGCRKCPYWLGRECGDCVRPAMGVSFRALVNTSGQVGPNRAGA
jgi:hypothetical protein